MQVVHEQETNTQHACDRSVVTKGEKKEINDLLKTLSLLGRFTSPFLYSMLIFIWVNKAFVIVPCM